ncbi:4-hydroxythreonine-4-phosphate dehydrogenase PdxA [Ramlibacter sp. AN1133]|uniref:4-hydroxythreonine-4-phosphate dehydrogenase PdxA n=1 Tax=Ramlibacter sp. AN1133 TaxID=3133429 RepID=UPI0030BD36DC
MPARKPRLALLLGDPAGVGPEMGVRLLANAANLEACELLLVAPPSLLAAGERIVGTKIPVLAAATREAVRFEPGRVALLAQREAEGGLPALGQCSEAAGAIALEALATATALARSGFVDGIVFAPLNKHSLRLAGMREEDELRFMQGLFGVQGFTCEFNITDGLWTSRVTSHVPVREVADLITPQAVADAVHILHDALRRAGIVRPRIAVSGLNPHAGDGGSIGREEIEVIAPTVERLKRDGLEASGPWSPDTVFIAARRGDFDAVVSMYHDQGQIAMKLMGFERGVTLHGGLPVPVATSASGSAFDIAGRGLARVDGLQAAFDLCLRMARQQLR